MKRSCEAKHGPQKEVEEAFRDNPLPPEGEFFICERRAGDREQRAVRERRLARTGSLNPHCCRFGWGKGCGRREGAPRPAAAAQRGYQLSISDVQHAALSVAPGVGPVATACPATSSQPTRRDVAGRNPLIRSDLRALVGGARGAAALAVRGGSICLTLHRCGSHPLWAGARFRSSKWQQRDFFTMLTGAPPGNQFGTIDGREKD
ncbi:hypothetical protein TraAM80_09464 [Trypanosoma rangeli]|uniref:Uncharacterized protein n=1 Tax=Trypanosoma rangeli TaxID=5698 RepID=A0A3R7M6U1_TRYRA|nr:uncharacterized protein TraAM80_09464 [Trypanosoma rangeli]RNE97226.1 hypothetical protein TraAM80_09464 [Trypanosoma rangeli]|eukprot:RNE97226.1 hypothetical protein TraAM80_09464 [Trypanosoma rangeli]